MPEKLKLNDSFLKTISGGYLPENWEKEVDMTIAYFKSYSDETVMQVGYRHDAEGLIAFLADENSKPGTMSASPEEFERVAGYIRSHY